MSRELRRGREVKNYKKWEGGVGPHETLRVGLLALWRLVSSHPVGAGRWALSSGDCWNSQFFRQP